MASGQRNLPYGGVMTVQVCPDMQNAQQVLSYNSDKNTAIISPGDVLMYNSSSPSAYTGLPEENDMYLRVGNVYKDGYEVGGIAFQSMTISNAEISSKTLKQHPTTNMQISGTAQVIVKGPINIGDYVCVDLVSSKQKNTNSAYHSNSQQQQANKPIDIIKYTPAASCLPELILTIVDAVQKNQKPAQKLVTIPGVDKALKQFKDALHGKTPAEMEMASFILAVEIAFCEDLFYVGMEDIGAVNDETLYWSTVWPTVCIEDLTKGVFCYEKLFPPSVTTSSLIENITIAFTTKFFCADIYNTTGGFHKLFKRLYNKWTLSEINSIQSRPRRGMPSSKKIIGKCIKIMEKIPIKGFDQSPIDRCRYVAIDICV